jgi:arylsulfatase
MGSITELATAAPGYNSIRPDTCAPLAETLKLNGYSTAQFGKCHEVPVWETSPMGPFNAWPTGGGGFEYFYGFIGGETNQYYPALYEGTTALEPAKTPAEGYHFTEDMTDKAINWVRQQKALMPDKPFFIYYVPGATHAPHQVNGQTNTRASSISWDPSEETFAAEGPWRDSRSCRINGAPQRDSRVGRCRSGAQTRAGAPDGSVCRVHGTYRLSQRAAVRFAGRPGHSG